MTGEPARVSKVPPAVESRPRRKAEKPVHGVDMDWGRRRLYVSPPIRYQNQHALYGSSGPAGQSGDPFPSRAPVGGPRTHNGVGRNTRRDAPGSLYRRLATFCEMRMPQTDQGRLVCFW